MKRRLDPSSLVVGETQVERTARLNRERASRHAASKRASRPPAKPATKAGAVVRAGALCVDPAHARVAALWALPW